MLLFFLLNNIIIFVSRTHQIHKRDVCVCVCVYRLCVILVYMHKIHKEESRLSRCLFDVNIAKCSLMQQLCLLCVEFYRRRVVVTLQTVQETGDDEPERERRERRSAATHDNKRPPGRRA